MAVRAKMRCDSITLARSNARKMGKDGEPVKDAAGNYVYETFDQPTVRLSAVADTSEENREFWSATPMGRVELTVSNPDAAEFFELSKEYYVDFEPAPVK